MPRANVPRAPAGSVKSMLLKCLTAQKDAEFIEEKIARFRSQMERMTARLSGLPKGTLQDDLSRLMAEIEELELEFGKRLIWATRESVRLCGMMSDLPDQQQELLRLRYIEGLDWDKISNKLCFSVQYCINLHTAALRNLKQSGSPSEIL